jgi:UDP-N-acetylglucosamine---dolichyl-phosphate N-acetylglucosaminyltransferase
MKLAIVIPVYNEEKIIKSVIDSLPKEIKGVDKIVVLAVNDGSTDNSSKEIAKTGAKLINHPINLGAGAATVTGLEAAAKVGADLAVTIDGDGQHDSADIKRLIKPVLADKADLVIGTRLKQAKGMPIIKQIGNWGLNVITYALSQMWTTDSQSGFKCFSRKAMDTMDIQALGYEFCSEIIIEAKRKKMRVVEIPTRAIYSNYSKKKGQSIFNGMNIIIKLLVKRITN